MAKWEEDGVLVLFIVSFISARLDEFGYKEMHYISLLYSFIMNLIGSLWWVYIYNRVWFEYSKYVSITYIPSLSAFYILPKKNVNVNFVLPDYVEQWKLPETTFTMHLWPFCSFKKMTPENKPYVYFANI